MFKVPKSRWELGEMSGSGMWQHALGLSEIQDTGSKRGGCGSQEWCRLDGDIAFSQSVFKFELTNVTVVDSNKYPRLLMLQNCFIRRSVVRYIQLPPKEVDTELLQDAAIECASSQSISLIRIASTDQLPNCISKFMSLKINTFA